MTALQLLAQLRRADVRLWVDGEPAADANLVSLGPGPDGRVHYLVEDLAIGHGALVRVDYDPSGGDP